MPIYAYRCAACGHDHEALQKISDAPLTQCPACGALALQKQVTAAGFQLKGSGWYVTDFRNNQTGAPPKGEKAEKGDKADAAASAAGPATEVKGAGGETPAGTSPAAAPAPTAAPSASAPAPAASSGAGSGPSAT